MNGRGLVPALAALAFLPLAGTATAATASRQGTTVNVAETEFRIVLSRTSAPTGWVTFNVRDDGKLAHDLIVLRTGRAPAKLPLKGDRVDLRKAGTVVGEVLGLQPGKTARLRMRLQRDRYVVLCNLPGHYGRGQFAGFRVT